MEAVPFRKGEGGGLNLHVRNFLDCMKTKEKPNAPVETGAHIARIAHLGNMAYRTGRKLFWDPSGNRVINDKEADILLLPAYREPWKLPEY